MVNNVTINLKEKTVTIINSLSKMKYKFIKYDHHNHKPTSLIYLLLNKYGHKIQKKTYFKGICEVFKNAKCI